MNRLARIGLIIVGILLIFFLVIAVGSSYMAKRPFPTTDGSITLNGLQDEVKIVRDTYGVPHIYANNQDDLFFAQGYITAQDRFWQMEFWRHIGMGRISEIAGEATLEQDRFIRTMGWNRMAESYIDYYEQEAPEFIAILEAYSAGVNAYIDENRDTCPCKSRFSAASTNPGKSNPGSPCIPSPGALSWPTTSAATGQTN